ncbi:hypothetical protein LEP1GSC021_0592 [Leptospira noguchii str. 1993005606]|uniref:Uncharacterized protein n=2 Tax=Leptospira noguchii TaxID=28182 RepID=M6VJI7_9LEPT|nr:hypothetical protein LEP1GSC035_1184 [Leptospira noguchii str. 2007001578]EMO55206.1 hypothetical protein LEP1GSC172_2255 [Leptospira noguchii]EPE82334.1 hypothetical protein LEP1GSC021_0592 [Leptospira noguchii str. 1993005606]
MLKNEFSIYFCFMEAVNSNGFINLDYEIFQQLYFTKKF